MKMLKQCLIISFILLIVYSVFICQSQAHKDKPHNIKAEDIIDSKVEKNIPIGDSKEDLNTRIPEIQHDINNSIKSIFVNQKNKKEEKMINFLYKYGILILGILTALSFLITVKFALFRRRFKSWMKYHHLFAIITGLLMITHAIIAIWLHFFY